MTDTSPGNHELSSDAVTAGTGDHAMSNEESAGEPRTGFWRRLGRQFAMSGSFVLREWRWIFGPTKRHVVVNVTGFVQWLILLAVVLWSSSGLARLAAGVVASAIASTLAFIAMERVYLNRIRRILEEYGDRDPEGDEIDQSPPTVLDRLNEVASSYQHFWTMASGVAAVIGVLVAVLAVVVSAVALLVR